MRVAQAPTSALPQHQMVEYQCCLCKDRVSATDQQSELDPCALILISNIDKQRGDQKEQEFFCHFECFRKTVNNDGILYIMDRNVATVGENESDEKNSSNPDPY
jgi:hypothetical protein